LLPAAQRAALPGRRTPSTALALPADGRLLACQIDAEPTRVARPLRGVAGVAAKIGLHRFDAGRAGRRPIPFSDGVTLARRPQDVPPEN